MAKKKFKELKKSRDVYFRKRAKSQALDPTTDINAEMRLVVKQAKGNPREIQEQKNTIKEAEKKNRAIRDDVRELENRYEFEDPEGKKKIEDELKKPEYVTKDISYEKNALRALEGKEFDFIVDDGFKKYKINTRQIKKIWKEGGDASIIILRKLKQNTKKAVAFYKGVIEKEQKTASKARMKKLNRIKDGLEKKLKYTIDQNIEAIESGDMSELDEISDDGEKAYSLLFKIVDFNIDRVGI